MKSIHGLDIAEDGTIIASGLGLRWTKEKHRLGGNFGPPGSMWHERPAEQQCDNLMRNGHMCNGHPMGQNKFVELVHKLSVEGRE